MNFIRLFNVEFDDKYDDVIMFSTKAEQSSYFSSRFIDEFGEDDLSVIKEFSNVKVYGNYNKLQTVNYAYFENEIDGVTRGYYAFVTSVGWAGIGVVSLTLSIDVFQTYMFEHKLAPSYVRRASVHQLTADGSKIYGKYLFTPENVDYGDEYYTENNTEIDNNIYTFKDPEAQEKFESSSYDVVWVFFVCTEPLRDNDDIEVDNTGGTLGMSDGLYYYAFPAVSGAYDTYLASLPEQYKIQRSDITANMFTVAELFRNFGKSTQVIAAYIVKNFSFPLHINVSYNSELEFRFSPFTITVDLSKNTPEEYSRILLRIYNGKAADGAAKAFAYIVPGLSNDQMSFTQELTFDAIDVDYDIKSQCFPYSYFSVTQDRGNEVIAKPQYCETRRTNDGTYDVVFSVKVTTSIGTYIKQGVGLAGGYLGNTPELRQVVNTALGQMPQVTDAYLNFLQTQKASFDTGMNHIYTQGAFNTLQGAVGGAISGAGKGGVVGAAVGGTFGLAGGILSTAQAVEKQQARVQDIQNTPDSLRKPGTDIRFEVLSKYWGVHVTHYKIPDEAKKRVSDYFKLYGYTINDFITDFDNFLDTRETFNYIETTSCRVVAKINVQHIEQLERIYDHGVRLWHYSASTWTGFDFNKKNGDYYGTPRTPETI